MKLTLRNSLNFYPCIKDLESDPSNSFDLKVRLGINPRTFVIYLNPILIVIVESCCISEDIIINVTKRRSARLMLSLELLNINYAKVLGSAIRLDQQGELVLVLRVTK